MREDSASKTKSKSITPRLATGIEIETFSYNISIRHLNKEKKHRFVRLYQPEKDISIGPQRDKTCLRGFRQSETQPSLLSYRD